MKRAILASAVLLSLFLVACGGSSSGTSTSGLTDRVFASNFYSSVVQIVDGTLDTSSTFTIGVGTYPTMLAIPNTAKPVTTTLAYNSVGISVSVISNSGETVAGTVTLPSAATSLIAMNSTVGIVAMPGLPCTGNLGAVGFLDIASTYSVSGLTCVTNVQRLVLSNAGGTLLAFNNTAHTVTLIDTTTTAYVARTITLAAFDYPVWGVFSADDSTAYILNCGPECGGTTASVQAINVSTGTAVGTPLALSGATMGLLSGSTLYVAGTTGGVAGAGVLNIVNVSASQPTLTTASLHISDGYHRQMVLGSNNKLFIGSTACTNNPNSATPTGCLSIFDVSAGGNPAVDSARDPLYCDPAPVACTRGKGDVTGMTALTGRSVVYVAEGGFLRIFSTTSSSETGEVSIGGAIIDVKAVDK